MFIYVVERSGCVFGCRAEPQDKFIVIVRIPKREREKTKKPQSRWRNYFRFGNGNKQKSSSWSRAKTKNHILRIISTIMCNSGVRLGVRFFQRYQVACWNEDISSKADLCDATRRESGAGEEDEATQRKAIASLQRYLFNNERAHTRRLRSENVDSISISTRQVMCENFHIAAQHNWCNDISTIWWCSSGWNWMPIISSRC